MCKYLIIADIDETMLRKSIPLFENLSTKELISLGIESAIEGITIDSVMENKGIVKSCSCTHWLEFMQRINLVIATATLRAGRDVLGDDYIKFKVCPWCGSELIERG